MININTTIPVTPWQKRSSPPISRPQQWLSFKNVCRMSSVEAAGVTSVPPSFTCHLSTALASGGLSNVQVRILELTSVCKGTGQSELTKQCATVYSGPRNPGKYRRINPYKSFPKNKRHKDLQGPSAVKGPVAAPPSNAQVVASPIHACELESHGICRIFSANMPKLTIQKVSCLLKK